jgi:hypothetical protein
MSSGRVQQRIVFGTNQQATDHAFRHSDALAFDRARVIQAIVDDLLPHLPLARPGNNLPFQGAVTVTGIRLKCHAFPLDDGLVNVGRITPA